ncbi:TadA family conjugal transfer-associated ATPase [Nakamurella lactea]|uniref:TadA family conjugal transfer-associated ATPase n=1 Tax=Nakamurella lactea TaxID=459515 RepID=UPI0003F9DFAE|nr:TadA family conjugal transfer-associated ATPase [Nakamurella lactea]
MSTAELNAIGTKTVDGLPAGLVERVQARLADERAEPTPASLARAVRGEQAGLVSDAEMLRLLHLLQRELVGAGPLAPLLADPDTTDVVVNGPDDVRVDRGNGWQRADVRFADEAAVQRLARRLATSVDRRLDEAHPYVDARLADGTRLHAVLAPVASSGSCLSLRVLRPVRHDLDQLAAGGALPGICEPLLRAIIEARLAFLISGGTGSGKTTLLSAMLAKVPPGERIVTVEDAEELRPPHPHLVRLVARPPNVEGAGAVDLRELVRQALRMCPDRIVVGEVRGAEVIDLLTALNTGHDGGAGTVHANTVRDVPARMEALAATGGVPREALHSQLAGAIAVVLHLRRDDGVRRLVEVGVLRRRQDGQVQPDPAVLEGLPVEPGASHLRELLLSRGVAPPW